MERAIGDGDCNGGRDLVVLPTSVMSVMFQCPAGWMAGMTSAFMSVVKNRVTMDIIMARMIGSGVVLVEKCRLTAFKFSRICVNGTKSPGLVILYFEFVVWGGLF
jgi:hypothetical protein